MNCKPSFIIAAALAIVSVSCESVDSMNQKAQKAIDEGNFEKAIELYEKVTQKGTQEEAAVAYYNLYCILEEGEFLKKSIENGMYDAIRTYMGSVWYPQPEDEDGELPFPVNEFVEIYKTHPDTNWTNDMKWDRDNDLAWLYLFEPSVTNPDSAGVYLLKHVDPAGKIIGGFNKEKVNLYAMAAVLLRNGLGGYEKKPGAAFTLKENVRAYEDDVCDEVMQTFGDLDLLGDIYQLGWTAEMCADKALQHYNRALNAANANIDDLNTRIDLLSEYNTCFGKMRDWVSYFNDISFFSYEGVVIKDYLNGDYPNGIGYGCWTKEPKVFIGYWNNGHTKNGIMATPDSTILYNE